ncbi:MAG TPA: IS1595 family transposase [Dongiaceae bacterium]|nr:IS1595 family transposase [Dongiaceae bacterium]
MFPDEQACSDYLKRVRWPSGFRCPHCGGNKGRQEMNRPLLWGCQDCGKQTSITAGTLMHASKLPLMYWFWAAYLVTSQANGVSALQLQKQLGIGSYKTAWLMLSKLRRAMVDTRKVSGVVEVGKAVIAFRSRHDPEATSRGRSADVKLIIVVAAERLALTDKSAVRRSRLGRIRIEPIGDTGRTSIHNFIRRNIEPGSVVFVDSQTAYHSLPDYSLKRGGGNNAGGTDNLRCAKEAVSLLKTLSLGTYHGFRKRYVPRYLDEFVWRFNRRDSRSASFQLLLGLSVKTRPWPLEEIRNEAIEVRPSSGRVKSSTMSLLKQGDKEQAVCHRDGIVSVTFDYQDLEFSDGKGIVEHILVGVCDKCGDPISIPPSRLLQSSRRGIDWIAERIPNRVKSPLRPASIVRYRKKHEAVCAATAERQSLNIPRKPYHITAHQLDQDGAFRLMRRSLSSSGAGHTSVNPFQRCAGHKPLFPAAVPACPFRLAHRQDGQKHPLKMLLQYM